MIGEKILKLGGGWRETMKKINRYFFDTESINLSDGLWFYGTYIITIAITSGVIISIL